MAFTFEPSAFMQATGLQLDEMGPDRVVGHLDAGPEHHQPFGVVHGGVYAAVAESAASIGAFLAVEDRGLTAVGVNNQTDFLRPHVSGRLEVVATPIQQGRNLQLWTIEIRNTEDKLIARSQVRLANVARS